jgi:hypothetical protein
LNAVQQLGRIIAWGCAAALALGCASVPLAPVAQDSAAKAFQPPTGKANLYVFRPHAFKMSAVTVNVTLNGRALGLLKVGTYVHAALEPGRYTLLSQSSKEMPVLVVAEPGTNYFFEQIVEDAAVWQSFARTTLVKVDEAAGRAGVSANELAASHPAPPPEPTGFGCTKDTDCKGDRVCNAGACVEAPPH